MFPGAMHGLCGAALTLVLWVGAAAWPQAAAGAPAEGKRAAAAKKQNKPSEPAQAKLKASGTIKRVGPGMLQVITGQGGQLLVGVVAKPEDIHLKAEGDTGFLQPGRYVQFVAVFNRRGEAQSPVEKLTIFTPRPTSRFGVAPYRGPEPTGEPEGGAEAVVDPFGDLVPDVAPEPSTETAAYRVAGRLTSNKRGWLTVSTGRSSVRVQVAPDVQVNLDVADYSLARPQDRVDFEGYHYPVRKGYAFANKMVITAARPLSSQPGSKHEPSEGAVDDPMLQDAPDKTNSAKPNL